MRHFSEGFLAAFAVIVLIGYALSRIGLDEEGDESRNDPETRFERRTCLAIAILAVIFIAIAGVLFG